MVLTCDCLVTGDAEVGRAPAGLRVPSPEKCLFGSFAPFSVFGRVSSIPCPSKLPRLLRAPCISIGITTYLPVVFHKITSRNSH